MLFGVGSSLVVYAGLTASQHYRPKRGGPSGHASIEWPGSQGHARLVQAEKNKYLHATRSEDRGPETRRRRHRRTKSDARRQSLKLRTLFHAFRRFRDSGSKKVSSAEPSLGSLSRFRVNPLRPLRAQKPAEAVPWTLGVAPLRQLYLCPGGSRGP